MRIVVLAGLTALAIGAGLFTAAPARAQQAPWGPSPWCLQTGNNFPNCSYYSYEQCAATARGAYRGWSCIQNPYATRGRAVRPRRGY